MVRQLFFTSMVLGIFALAGSSSAIAQHGCDNYWGGGYGVGYYSYRPSASFYYGYSPSYGYYSARRSHYRHHAHHGHHDYGYGGHGYGGHGGAHFSFGF